MIRVFDSCAGRLRIGLSLIRKGQRQKRAEVVVKVLRARRPERHYHVGHMSGAARILELFPQTFVDWILKKVKES